MRERESIALDMFNGRGENKVNPQYAKKIEPKLVEGAALCQTQETRDPM